jgi:hypothetical protein
MSKTRHTAEEIVAKLQRGARWLSKPERDSAPAEALSYLNQGVSGGGYLRTLFGLIRNAPGESILPGQGKQGVSSWGTPAKGRTTKPSAKALITTLVYIIVEVRIYRNEPGIRTVRFRRRSRASPYLPIGAPCHVPLGWARTIVAGRAPRQAGSPCLSFSDTAQEQSEW